MLWFGVFLGVAIAAWGLKYNKPCIRDIDLQRAHFLIGGVFTYVMLIGALVL
jgi:hypothetical protein